LNKSKIPLFNNKRKDIIIEHYNDIVKHKSFYFLGDLKIDVGRETINRLNQYFTFKDDVSQSIIVDISIYLLNKYTIPLRETNPHPSVQIVEIVGKLPPLTCCHHGKRHLFSKN
jgi:hypothetical protein